MTRYLEVISGKGGVGKTTVALNLAAALDKLGADALLCDADVLKANVSLHLGAHKFKVTLHEVLWDHKHMKDALYYHPSGLRFVPAGISSFHVKQSTPDMLSKIPSKLAGLADVIILDGPLGDRAYLEQFFSILDEAVMVTTPDLPSLTDCLRIIDDLEKHKVKILGVVVNRMFFTKFETKKENIESMLQLPVIGEIPENVTIKESLKNERPAVTHDPECVVSKGFKKLASKIMGQEYISLSDETHHA